MKKKLIFLFTVMLVSVVVTGCTENVNKTKEEQIVNKNEEVIKNQTVEVFSFSKTSLVYSGGTSTLITSVKNNSSKTEYIKSFNIIVKDANGNLVVTMLGYIGEEIPAGETRQITSNTDLNLSKAVSIEYTINR